MPPEKQDLINRGCLAWKRLYDVGRPETPDEVSVHHFD